MTNPCTTIRRAAFRAAPTRTISDASLFLLAPRCLRSFSERCSCRNRGSHRHLHNPYRTGVSSIHSGSLGEILGTERLADEFQVEPPSKITIASLKDGVGLCMQTGGNMSRMYADLLKLQKLYLEDAISSGGIILPTSKASRDLGDNIANADRLAAELKIFRRSHPHAHRSFLFRIEVSLNDVNRIPPPPRQSPYGWPLPDRREEFKKLVSTASGDTFRVENFKGSMISLPIVRIPINLSKYRIAGGRTASAQQEWVSTHGEPIDFFDAGDPELETIQIAQHDILRSMIKEEGLLEKFKDPVQRQVEPLLLDESRVRFERQQAPLLLARTIFILTKQSTRTSGMLTLLFCRIAMIRNLTASKPGSRSIEKSEATTLGTLRPI